MGALALVLALALWLLLFRGNGGTEYTLLFQNAGQLVVDDDVQVGGRRVGAIESIELTDDNQAAIRITVQEPYAPLREGTRAVIRLTSLSGVANRYVALTPGEGDARELDEGATLTQQSTTDVVDLDQIFNTLDENTRGDLADVIQGFATQYDNRGDAAGESAKYFNPLLSSSRRLVQEVTEDQGALTRLLVNTSQASGAIAERRDDLSSLVGNANATAAAIAAENASLARALGLLPTTLRRANTTFVNLRATLDDLDVLVAESKPATRDLAPFLRELRPLVAEARPTIRDLRTLVRQPGDDNDLTEAIAQAARAAARRHARRSATAAGRCEDVAARARVRAPVHARPRRLVPRLRAGRRELRRQRPLRADPADLQRLRVRRQPGRRPADADPGRRTASTGSKRRDPPLPRRRDPAPGGRLRAVPRYPAASTATRASCPPAHESAPSPSEPCCSSPPRSWWCWSRAARTSRTGCGRSSTTPAS